MKFTSLHDTGCLYIEFCADRTMQASGLVENTLLELRGEGRACALTMEHVRQRPDDPAFFVQAACGLAPMSRLVDQIKQALAALVGCKTTAAPIGGLALAVHQVVRATRDVDFLADADDADRLHGILLAPGYRCVHRSEDAANYVRDDEGLDPSMHTGQSRDDC